MGIAVNGAVGKTGEESREVRKLLGEGRAEGIGVKLVSSGGEDSGGVEVGVGCG